MLEQWLRKQCHYRVHLVAVLGLLIVSHDLPQQMELAHLYAIVDIIGG